MTGFFVGVVVTLLLVAGLRMGGSPPPYDDTDAPPARSGLKVLTDARTGCQYLTTARGGLTPRLGRDGRHLCAPKEDES